MGFNPDNIKVTSGRDSNYKSSSDVKGRPTTDPDARKDFKKVLDKGSDDEEENNAAKEIIEETDGIGLAMLEDTKKKPPLSLFDLTGSKKSPRFEEKPPEQVVVVPITDPDAKKIVADIKPVKANFSDADAVAASLLEKAEAPAPVQAQDKDKFTTRFSTEQDDLSYVNPLAATTNQLPSVNLNISTEKAVIPVSNLQEIINQMIAKATEMKRDGMTETILTLKHPPLFAGANIVVTAFDSAKNEFNIAIENLTQAAKNLMDIKINKDNLLLALEQKGYAVHILATTTVAENRVVDTLPQEDQRQREGREGQQQQQQKGREDKG